MAENVAEMRAEGTMVAGTEERRGQGRGQRFGVYGLIAAVIVATVIGGAAVHNRGGSHPATPAISRITSAEMKFLENNTTNLPNAITAEVRPVVTSGQQRYFDVNTAWLPTTTDAASSAMTIGQRRFLEVNTVMLPAGPSYSYTEDVTPPLGHPR